MENLPNKLKLCLITNQTDQTIQKYIEIIKEADHGGVTMVQLRDKSRNIDEIKAIALELKQVLRPFKIPLIINDHVELASQIDADGVHIGQSDMQIKEARSLLGYDKIIGISIESLTDLIAVNRLVGNYYVAASAVFASSSKLNCKKIWGLAGLEEVVQNSIHPVIAVGNINQTNIKAVVQTGVAGVAVISAIHDFIPFKAAQELFKSNRGKI